MLEFFFLRLAAAFSCTCFRFEIAVEATPELLVTYEAIARVDYGSTTFDSLSRWCFFALTSPVSTML